MRPRARKRVFDFVAKYPDASARQIAHGLGMTAPAVRHHLAILRADGRLDLANSGVPSQRGRPEKRYRVAERLTGNNLAMISDTLLKARNATSNAAARQRLIGVLSKGLQDQLGLIEGGSSASSRIVLLVARLNQLHYEAHWEAGAEGPRLIFDHCPYAAVIENHPELCQMDARAVSQATATDARQLAKIDVHGRGPTQCIFSLR